MGNLSIFNKKNKDETNGKKIPPQIQYLKKYGELNNPEKANEVMDKALQGDLSLFQDQDKKKE